MKGNEKAGPGDAHPTPAKHSDSPPDRPERQTGTGTEATEGTKTGEEHDHEHRSGYGGSGGDPVTSSDQR